MALLPGRLTLLGLVRHLAEVERGWFRDFTEDDVRPLYCTDPDGDWNGVPDADTAADLATYRAEVEAIRELLAGHDLDETQVDGGRTYGLRWIYTHMIEEFARHNGHADLLREAIDGAPVTPEQQPRAVVRVREALEILGATGQVRLLPASARTAVEAAAALGCPVGAIASSLVFDAGGEPVLVITSGAHRVDTAKVAADHGLAPLGRAGAEFVRAHTGQAIGGVAPVGHSAPVRTFVDRWLDRHETVWAAGGHPHAVFPTTYGELVSLTGGTPADVE